jgi:hypothetical protein
VKQSDNAGQRPGDLLENDAVIILVEVALSCRVRLKSSLPTWSFFEGIVMREK